MLVSRLMIRASQLAAVEQRQSVSPRPRPVHRSGDAAVHPSRQRDVVTGIADRTLPQRRVAGMRQDLVDTTAEHHVAAQGQRDGTVSGSVSRSVVHHCRSCQGYSMRYDEGGLSVLRWRQELVDLGYDDRPLSHRRRNSLDRPVADIPDREDPGNGRLMGLWRAIDLPESRCGRLRSGHQETRPRPAGCRPEATPYAAAPRS